MNLQDFKFDLPLVAILRGLAPEDAESVGRTLFDAGLRLIEVPLNRPGAIAAMRAIRALAPPDALVGGGTMLSVADVDTVAEAGGQIFVAPNCDPPVIAHAAARGLLCAPGVATPSEAFAALAAGAHILKLFPAEMVTPAGLKAMKSVLPDGTPLWPVGSVTPDRIGEWKAAGATGAGIGSALFAPGVAPDELARRARAFVAAWHGG